MVEGPLVPYLEPYSEYIADLGYSQESYWRKTYLLSLFSQWLGRENIAAEGITLEHKEAFLRDNTQCRHNRQGDPFTLSNIIGWLQERGVISPKTTSSAEMSGVDRIIQEYVSYLYEDRGLAPSTIEIYAGTVRRFLTSIFSAEIPQLALIHASQITDYIRRKAPRNRTFASAKNTVTALRSFFHFARYRDYIQTDLSAAVPSVAGWAMTSIPRAMPADCVRQLLEESKKWRTQEGLRNRAILLLLARLGLRAQEIICLELSDIDWSQGWLKIHGKSRQDQPMPLPHDVGQAVAFYLKDGRPVSTCRKVFLRSRAPFDGLGSHTAICQIVKRAIKRANINIDATGSHQLRHALAVNMLRQGLSLTEIGQVLRHRSPEITRRYAKVDLEGLREVALLWPGELP